VTPEDSGVVSGLANTTQQAGGAAGVAVAATLATGRTGHLLAAGTPAGPALAAGYHLAFGAGAGLIALGLAATIAATLVGMDTGAGHGRHPATPRSRSAPRELTSLRSRRRPADLPPRPRTPAARATDRERQQGRAGRR
jgi:hypothetical protein